MAQTVKNLPAVQETRVQSLGLEGPLEKELATYSSTLAWRLSWQATVLGITKSWTQATDFHFSLSVLSIEYAVDPCPLKCFDWDPILSGNPVTHITETNVS